MLSTADGGWKTGAASNGLRRLLGALAPGLLLSATVASGPASAQAPSPNYSGELMTRSTFTGDWGGVRNELASSI
jgi:hypothetical protein